MTFASLRFADPGGQLERLQRRSACALETTISALEQACVVRAEFTLGP